MDLIVFQQRGFALFEDAEIEKLIGNLPNLNEWLIDSTGVEYPKDVDLTPAHEYIKNKYVDPYCKFVSYGYKGVWNKTDAPSLEWHNDLVEGPNLFFMYYLSDITQGGELMFRVDKKPTGLIQPRKHLLVMASQESNVEHKVNVTEQTRIVCNFGFNVQWN
jgi:hypothetical protein